MYLFGKQCNEGVGETPRNAFKAAFWFRHAAKREHVSSALELAQLYESGQLGEKVRPVSVRFFKQAAKAREVSKPIAPAATVDLESAAKINKQVKNGSVHARPVSNEELSRLNMGYSWVCLQGKILSTADREITRLVCGGFGYSPYVLTGNGNSSSFFKVSRLFNFPFV